MGSSLVAFLAGLVAGLAAIGLRHVCYTRAVQQVSMSAERKRGLFADDARRHDAT